MAGFTARSYSKNFRNSEECSAFSFNFAEGATVPETIDRVIAIVNPVTVPAMSLNSINLFSVYRSRRGFYLLFFVQ